MSAETSFGIASYLWDYFYISHYPTDNDAKAWRRIECAAIRIRESESFLRDAYPPAVRVKNAKRVRRAVREILRFVPELEATPEQGVAEALGFFAVLADDVIERCAELAKAQPLH